MGATWRHKDKAARSCLWVGKNPTKRCKFTEGACQASCGCEASGDPDDPEEDDATSTCTDDAAWYMKKTRQDCAWVAKKTSVRCNKKAKKGPLKGTKAKDACRLTCDPCL